MRTPPVSLRPTASVPLSVTLISATPRASSGARGAKRSAQARATTKLRRSCATVSRQPSPNPPPEPLSPAHPHPVSSTNGFSRETDMARTKTKSAEVAAEVAAEEAAQPAPVISAVKGFNADLQCAPDGKPFQFEIGKTYSVAGKIKACSNGFHAVDWDNPFHVWDFYPVVGDDGRMARYAE